MTWFIDKQYHFYRYSAIYLSNFNKTIRKTGGNYGRQWTAIAPMCLGSGAIRQWGRLRSDDRRSVVATTGTFVSCLYTHLYAAQQEAAAVAMDELLAPALDSEVARLPRG